jgi:ABC-type dipeptide/oligopeptide/nickel transport system permease subunit
MLTSAANLLNSAPQLTIEPGLVITLLVLCVSVVSDAVQSVASAGGVR